MSRRFQTHTEMIDELERKLRFERTALAVFAEELSQAKLELIEAREKISELQEDLVRERIKIRGEFICSRCLLGKDAEGARISPEF